jgi:hypothetical protein
MKKSLKGYSNNVQEHILGFLFEYIVFVFVFLAIAQAF